MGWTYTHAICRTDRGAIDKKAEIERIIDKRYEVLKSVFVGSTYYAAVKGTETGEVSGHVVLTSTRARDYYDFGYKFIGEACGPCERNCPASVLDLLTPTDNEYAIRWREACRENLKKKKDPNALNNLPVGSEIRFTNWKGEEIHLVKHPAAYQFKRPFWYNPERNCYIKRNHLPREYEVVSA